MANSINYILSNIQYHAHQFFFITCLTRDLYNAHTISILPRNMISRHCHFLIRLKTHTQISHHAKLNESLKSNYI